MGLENSKPLSKNYQKILVPRNECMVDVCSIIYNVLLKILLFGIRGTRKLAFPNWSLGKKNRQLLCYLCLCPPFRFLKGGMIFWRTKECRLEPNLRNSISTLGGWLLMDGGVMRTYDTIRRYSFHENRVCRIDAGLSSIWYSKCSLFGIRGSRIGMKYASGFSLSLRAFVSKCLIPYPKKRRYSFHEMSVWWMCAR